MNRLISVGLAIFLFSCAAPDPQINNDPSTPAQVNIDSLKALFVARWNLKDSAAIVATLANDAIVMNDSLIHKGIDEIAKNWVSGGVKVLSNIVTTSVIRSSDTQIAFDAGTYTLDLTIPEGPKLKEHGNYSMIWTKVKEEKWLLTLVHIEDISRLPDIQ